MGDVTVAHSLLAGSVAGVVAIVVCHPLDTIRVRLQTSQKFSGALDCATQTVRNEGALALYKGMAVPLMAQAVYKAVMFGAYNGSQTLLKNFLKQPGGTTPVLAVHHLFVCGGVAGGVNSFVVTPVELIRNRLMVDYAAKKELRVFRGPVHCALSVIREKGVLGLYRGLSPTLLRDIPGVGTWYASFELARRFLSANQWVGLSANLLAGACAGIGFWTVSLPFDRIKSIIQTDMESRYKNVFHCVRMTVRDEGIFSLYKGWTVAFMRGIPGSAVTFSVFNYVIGLLANK